MRRDVGGLKIEKEKSNYEICKSEGPRIKDPLDRKCFEFKMRL